MVPLIRSLNCPQQTLGSCVCTDGFTGPDCSQVITPGTVLWEVLSHGRSLNISTNYLARMGHSMVHGPGVLLAYAGYSLGHGLLNDLQRFNLSSNTWSLVEVNQLESSIPSARYLHSAVFYIVSICKKFRPFNVGHFLSHIGEISDTSLKQYKKKPRNLSKITTVKISQ